MPGESARAGFCCVVGVEGVVWFGGVVCGFVSGLDSGLGLSAVGYAIRPW